MNSIELEAKFIEQEHRLVPIWTHFWLDRRKWEDDDPRRIAANKAFLWFWFRQSSYVIVSGGVVALISLYFLSKQTSLLEEQNTLVSNQNQLLVAQINQQNKVNNAAKKTEVISVIFESKEKSSEIGFYTKAIPETAPRVRSEAIAEYLEIRKSEMLSDFEEFKKTGVRPFVATLPFGVDLQRAPLQNVSLKQIDMNNMSLSYSSFKFAELSFVDFSNSHLNYVNFANAMLYGSIFDDASLVGSYMVGADLSGIKWNSGTLIKNANIYGVKNAPEGFREWALKKGAVEFPDRDKWIEHIVRTFPALKKYIDE